jgi:predicted NAD/FAD-binding protein
MLCLVVQEITKQGSVTLVIVCVQAELPDVRVSTPVTHVVPATGTSRAEVHAADGSVEEVDAVIFATHTETTLAALGDLAPEV